MQKLFFALVWLLTAGSMLPGKTAGQGNIGIGTKTPNARAALDIKSTDKGVLFPSMTTEQRNAISNPPNGLHVFNTDQRCLNYYDSLAQAWNCYCENCRTVIINITSNACHLDFYEAFAKAKPASSYIINVGQGVVISGCVAGDTAFQFNSLPFNADIRINNYGTIHGAGGTGGSGTYEVGCSGLFAPSTPGKPGGVALSTKTGVKIEVNNFGILAGGGGGGGGSGAVNGAGFGGGGGGGAGIAGGTGGVAGGQYQSTMFGGCVPRPLAQPGATGLATTGGTGGAGLNGGAKGGDGGNRGEAGKNGSGNFSAIGGVAGKAIGGGAGNSVTNKSGGQLFGSVD